jgi:tetratricopeptide (TPR) repeat protein
VSFLVDIHFILLHLECASQFGQARTGAGSGGRLPAHLPSSEISDHSPLAGHTVVFTGKLSLLGRKEARALVTRLGGATADDVSARTTMVVIGAAQFGQAGDRERTGKLKRAEELNGQQGAGIQILSEEEFCRLAGVPTLDAIKRQYHAVRDLLARYRTLRDDHVRYLVKYGVIRPALRTNADTWFAFPDVAVLKQANDELERGVPFRMVARSLLASREGQLTFDFRLDAAPAKIITLQSRPAPRAEMLGSDRPAALGRDTVLAEEYFRAASQLDDGDETKLEEAASGYRKALELDPYLVAALINLANIHYSRDELAEAQALYERAIGLESDFFEAHFNLGNIYHDLGRFAEAQACYREALRLNPKYADAHFYLAVTFEKMGLSQEARPHWRTYQQLAPHGEWVELAREFSD